MLVVGKAPSVDRGVPGRSALRRGGSPPRPLAIGYLHIGSPEHGVTRYGRLLADEARVSPELSVEECSVKLKGAAARDRRRIRMAARALAGVDLVHIQYNNQPSGCVWGDSWRQVMNLWQFLRVVKPPVVVTIHDIYRPSGDDTWLHRVRRAATPQAAARRLLLRKAKAVIVSSEHERERLGGRDSMVVIPLFVEPRDLPRDADAVRAGLGLSGKRVVTLLGQIQPRKGHRLLIDALAHLPEDVVAIFAGDAPGRKTKIVRDLIAAAHARGVDHRVAITGYVADDELNRYLAATHLAVCPFKDVSSSASIGTWISAGRPVVASALPMCAGYNALEPGAIRTFEPYTAEALAAAIREALEIDDASTAIERLREQLALPSILHRFIDVYHDAIGVEPREQHATVSS